MMKRFAAVVALAVAVEAAGEYTVTGVSTPGTAS